MGQVEGCPSHRRKHTFADLLPLGLALLVIWMGAGFVARRLTRPLVRLQRVAHDLGEGQLESRVTLGGRPPPEVEEVATAVNTMADRIARQPADQKEPLAAVSHELRTPLGHMRLLIETARDRGADARIEKTLTNLEREIVELDKLTGQLLASSRLELGQPQLVSVDAAAVAREALERQGLPASLLEAEGAVQVRLGPTLVARALANLLDNAERHAGGATALRVRSEGGAVLFEVGDDGDGPPAPETWEPYHQGKGQGLKRGTLGLGLALVRRIAEAHGGEASAMRPPRGGRRLVRAQPPRGLSASRATHRT